MRLKGVTRAVSVKITQKRVFFKDFKNQLRLKQRLQLPGERCFTNPNDAFNRKIHESLLIQFSALRRDVMVLKLKYTIHYLRGGEGAP